jgi:hypothetical protein
LEKKLEKEMTDGSEARQRWLDREQTLLNSARVDRAKLRELRDLHAIKEMQSYEDEDSDSSSSSGKQAANAGPSKAEIVLKEENLRVCVNKVVVYKCFSYMLIVVFRI